MDREAWRAVVHGVAKSRTWLGDWTEQWNITQSQKRVKWCHLQQHGLQHTRPPRPSPFPRVRSNSCPLSWWRNPTISSSVFPFSSCPQSFPGSGSLPMSWLFTSGGQSIGASALASVLPMNTQGWCPLVLTGLISLAREIWLLVKTCQTELLLKTLK